MSLLKSLLQPFFLAFGWGLSCVLVQSQGVNAVVAMLKNWQIPINYVPFFCLMVMGIAAKVLSPGLVTICKSGSKQTSNSLSFRITKADQHLNESLLLLVGGVVTANSIGLPKELFAGFCLINVVSMTVYYLLSFIDSTSARTVLRDIANGAALALFLSAIYPGSESQYLNFRGHSTVLLEKTHQVVAHCWTQGIKFIREKTDL